MSLEERIEYDKIKTEYCACHQIPLLRIPYWEKDNIDTILSERLLDNNKGANVE